MSRKVFKLHKRYIHSRDARKPCRSSDEKLRPVSATETCENTQLADDLQSATTGPVLTCSNASRSAFLDAIVLPQPSGYPGDTNDVPTVVIQPVGM